MVNNITNINVEEAKQAYDKENQDFAFENDKVIHHLTDEQHVLWYASYKEFIQIEEVEKKHTLLHASENYDKEEHRKIIWELSQKKDLADIYKKILWVSIMESIKEEYKENTELSLISNGEVVARKTMVRAFYHHLVFNFGN